MTDNPFSKFAAKSSTTPQNGGGWMTTRKSGRDDSAIRRAAEEAAEARKAKNRRGDKGSGTSKGRKKAASKGRVRRRRDDSDSEASFLADDDELDEDDDFIAHSEEEEMSEEQSEMEGDWNEYLEDDDSFGGEKKVKKSSNKVNKPNKPIRGKKTLETRGKRGRERQKVVYDVDGTDSEVDQSIDDIYESSPEAKPKPKFQKLTESKYFSQNSNSETDVEEKKEEDVVIVKSASGGNKGNNRRILDDDSSDDEHVGFVSSTFPAKKSTHNSDESLLEDTPIKPKGNQFSNDDFISDDEEAAAVAAAIKASMKSTDKSRKRLKKHGKSSLEKISKKKAKKGPKVIYKDDLEQEEPENNNDSGEDDEISVASHVSDDEEQKTAAQVLEEANALSAKIVKIVTQWCGGENSEESLSSKGLILGEGALNLDGGGGGGLTQFTQADDNEWISEEVMKKIMPTVNLASYQLLGVNWMALLNRLNFRKGGKKGMNVNGILADEMGLGKTVQTIAFLAWLNYQNGGALPSSGGTGADNAITLDSDNDGDDAFMLDNTNRNEKEAQDTRRPHLIVVPASVLSNWMNEFKKFAPHMVVVKYHGNQSEREAIKAEMRKYLAKDKESSPKNAHLDVVLTTFSYFSSEKGEDRSFLRKFHFDYLVVDEGHTLKNPKGLRYKNLNKFVTTHRLLLTGTPVQNSPKELMSLLCFLMPLFDSKTKSSKSKGFDSDDEKGSDGGERMLEHFVHLEAEDGSDAAAYRKLKQLFAPFVLRRKKSDVLSQIMPPKTRQVDLVDMDEATTSVYNAILSNHVNGGSGAKAQSKELAAFTSMSAQKHLFTELRKAANHPLLLRTRFLDDKDVNDLSLRLLNYNYFGSDATCTLQLVKNQLEKLSDYDIHCAAYCLIEENPARKEYLEKYTLVQDDMFCSPKFARLRVLLPELVHQGHRVLLFSQWTRVLDLMDNLLEMLDMKFLRLDGSTNVSDRQALIDTFTNDPSIPVFLLSTRAGGMGLNLTAADVCILHDLDFNPFNDRQAEDRCHRIGQKKPVTIIKMVTRGTVDESIYSLQERKERMNEAIMDESGTKKSDNDDIKEIMKTAVDNFLKSPTAKMKAPLAESKSVRVETISIED